MAQIKFKRALSHNGDLDSAFTNIKTLGLAPGEPILCSYVEDDVDKYLFELYDQNKIEAVLMHHDYGYSLCISTHVGCNMGCKFCESGRLKKIRNF